MLDIDKVIDDFNNSELKDKLVEEMTKEQLKKIFNDKLNEPVNEDYYRVLDGEDTAEGTISTVSTLPEGTIMSIDATTRVCNIKEHDQRRKIIFNKRELLESLGLYELAATYPSDSTVELKVTVVGRDCDDLGHPIDFN